MAVFTKQSGKYLYTPSTVPDADVDVEVGDVTQSSFFPQVKLKRWGNAANCSFRIQIPGGQKETVAEQGEQIVWSKGDYQAIWYDRPDASGEGGLEFEIILGKRPPTNSLTFSIVYNDCEFYYQDSASLPNVIGSYAVYSASKRHNQYKCGKICHIYRPHAVDSAGNEVWGTVSIDPVAGTMALSLPQEFLNTATYPITVDPTFGYTSVGVSYQFQNTNLLMAYSATAVGGGTITEIKWYCNSNDDGISSVDLAVYNDSGGNPSSKIVSGNTTPSTGFWASVSVSAAFTSGTKWLAIRANGEMQSAVDNATGTRKHRTGQSSLPDPFGTPDGTYSPELASMYVTYTAAPVARRRLTLLGVA